MIDLAAPTVGATRIRFRTRGKIRTSRFTIGFWVALGWLSLLVLLALFVDVLGLPRYDQTVGAPRLPPQLDYPLLLGTDSVGRSVLTRVIYGARVSLLVGFVAVIIAVAIGSILGLLAAYFRGWIEAVVAVVTDTILAFPAVILLMAIAAAVTPNLLTLTVSLGVLAVPGIIRLVKANSLQALGQEYVTSARAVGASTSRIMFREILPNATLPLLSYAILVAAVLMVAEGSLSFLGLGIPAPAPSWGAMVAAGRVELSREPQLVLIPSAVLFFTVFSMNTIGDGLRKVLSTRG